MSVGDYQFGREFSLRSYPSYMDRRTCRWLYFTEGKKGDYVSYTPEGKVVFADRDSEVFPDCPGEHLAAGVKECRSVAFARLIQFHGGADFSRDAAFGRTQDGETRINSHHRRDRIHLDFVIDPSAERIELLHYDCCRWETPDGRWEYLEFRHGQWRIVNYGLPHLLSDDHYADARRRALEFERKHIIMPADRSPASNWSDALKAGVVTQEEYEEASRRHAKMWHYAGT